jgi:hypothetical protein
VGIVPPKEGTRVTGLGRKKEGEDPVRAKQALVEERELVVNELLERFLQDFGRLLAGHSVPFDYMDPITAQLLRQAAEPFLSTGERLRPDFDEWAHREIIGDRDRPERPIHVRVFFRDQSVLETVDGGRLRNVPQDITAELLVSGDGRQILGIKMSGGRRGSDEEKE